MVFPADAVRATPCTPPQWAPDIQERPSADRIDRAFIRRQREESMIGEPASKLHFSSLVFDTHSDSLARTVDDGEDLGAETGKGHMDLPRMRAGNQKAQFFATFVDPHRFTPDDAVRRTTSYFDAFDVLCAAYPGEIAQARSAADVRRITESGKIAGVLCVEGGHAMVDSLDVLRMFHERGARYMTLTHNNSNNWADGIQEEAGREAPTDWHKVRDAMARKGLGPQRALAQRADRLWARGGGLEMNRLGVIVDISHVARKTFWDAIETTTKPVMASHSSSWTICKNPRNIDDDQLQGRWREPRRRLRELRGHLHIGLLQPGDARDRQVARPEDRGDRREVRGRPRWPGGGAGRRGGGAREALGPRAEEAPVHRDRQPHRPHGERRGHRPRRPRLRLRRVEDAHRDGGLLQGTPHHRGDDEPRLPRRTSARYWA